MSETTNEERDGRGDFYVQTDGSRTAIRQVLDDRKRRHNAQDRAVRERAFRERAWQQALLLQCMCCYPIVMADTASSHEEWCPAHALWATSALTRQAEQKKIDEDRAAKLGKQTVYEHHGLDPAMEGVEYTMATCPQCKADVPDHDGFGVLAHLKPVHADGCGYCTHPSADVVAGKGSVCGICGEVIESDVATTPVQRFEPEDLVTVSVPEMHGEIDGVHFVVPPAILVVDEPTAAKLAATSGDREKIARAFLAAPPTGEDHEVLLNALATKDVKREP